MAFKFRFRLVPFVASVIVASIAVSLGQWQLRRATEKQAIEASIQSLEREPALNLNSFSGGTIEPYRKVRAHGRFVSAWPIYLDNRPHQGKAGFYVVMPFHLNGSNAHVLVARGWAERDKIERTRLPALTTPNQLVELEGLALNNLPRVMELGEAPELKPGAIVQNIAPEEVAKAVGIAVLPWFVQQTNDTGDGLARDWLKPSSGIDKHHGYAVQWFGLAATALIFFIVTGLRRERN
jgi:cytochrome oxidase assembly protein ShyY1